jgi:hypothetical protein
MKGGLSKEEARLAVDAMFEDKARVRMAKAEGAVVNEEKAMAQAWAVRMDEARAAAAVARKQAAVNILRRQALEERISVIKAEGFTGMDAIEALLVGSNRRFTGARNSIDAARMALKKDFLGGLFNDLEATNTPIQNLFRDEGFSADVVREIISPGGTNNAEARRVAEVMSRHMEKARLRMNEAGASIGKLDGYIPQSHDAWKLTAGQRDGRSARQGWIEGIRDRLDPAKTFGMDAAEAATPEGAAEVTRILSAIYDNITLGRDIGPTAVERGERTGAPNLANKLARHRVLHFKDADAFLAYHAEYGRGGALTGVLTHLDTAARSTALLETLGTNPETMLKSIIAGETRELREATAGGDIGRREMQALKRLQEAQDLKGNSQVAAWWKELTGEANWPTNLGIARYTAMARAVQSMSKLGFATISAIADLPNKAMNMRVHGSSWPRALLEGFSQYFESYTGDKRRLALDLGAFVDDVGNDLRLRWDMSETMPGRLAGLQDRFFRRSFYGKTLSVKAWRIFFIRRAYVGLIGYLRELLHG